MVGCGGKSRTTEDRIRVDDTLSNGAGKGGKDRTTDGRRMKGLSEYQSIRG